MRVFSAIYRVLRRACAVNAVVTLLMYLMAYTTAQRTNLAFRNFMLIFAFAAIAAAMQEFFALRRLHILLRILIHYLVLTVSFVLLFAVFTGIATRASQIFIYIILFTITYALVTGITFALLRRFGYYRVHLSTITHTAEETPYVSRYQ